jgi:hypothetical protein
VFDQFFYTFIKDKVPKNNGYSTPASQKEKVFGKTCNALQLRHSRQRGHTLTGQPAAIPYQHCFTASTL